MEVIPFDTYAVYDSVFSDSDTASKFRSGQSFVVRHHGDVVPGICRAVT
jgi:hypothetical protein